MTEQILFRKFVSGLMLAALLLASTLTQAARLNDIRVWNAPDYTRIVLDLDTAPKFKQFWVANPARYVVDLPGFSLGAVQNIDAVKTGPYLKRVRVGTPKKNVARVVLELAQEVKVKYQVLPPVQNYMHRLVLDVYPKKPAAGNKPAVKHSTAKSSGSASSPRPPSRANDNTFVVAIDPGHGGEDSGARGRRSKEKDVVLQIAKRLQKKINAQKGMRAILTRKGDYFISLRKRTEIAREAGADVFISIHADAFTKKSARGSSVYSLSLRGASSERARVLADKENAADLVGGVDISGESDTMAFTLLDLTMNATNNDSIIFARSVYKELKKIGKTHSNAAETAGFVVLKSPAIPSILVETAFISNPAEEKLLRSARYQEKLANAILLGTRRYYQEDFKYYKNISGAN